MTSLDELLSMKRLTTAPLAELLRYLRDDVPITVVRNNDEELPVRSFDIVTLEGGGAAPEYIAIHLEATAPVSCCGPLVDEYMAWMKRHGLTLGSADEHLNDENLTHAQRDWLDLFVQRWNLAEKAERMNSGAPVAPSAEPAKLPYVLPVYLVDGRYLCGADAELIAELVSATPAEAAAIVTAINEGRS